MILCILGSGGHTSELLTLIQDIESQFIFICSKDDNLSAIKAMKRYPNAKIYTIMRPRLPAQPIVYAIPRILASFFSSLFVAFQIFLNYNIKVVIGNGPGICVLLFLIFRILGMNTVYVESFARVNSLSLTGKLVKHYCRNFIVQWKRNGELAMEWIV